MVIKVNDLAQRQRLGSTSKSPRWVVAFKFAAEQALTRLQSTSRSQVGKTGHADAGGPPGPGAPGRHHRQPGQPAQCRFHRQQGHPRRRHGRRREGRRDHSLHRPLRSRGPHWQEKVFQFPKVCPRCGSPVKRDEGSVFYRCTRLANASASSDGSCAPSPAAAPWTSRGWAKKSSTSSSMPAWSSRYPTFIA